MNNHTPNRFRLASALRRNDQGIALPMVLLIFIVGVALIGAFLVAIVGSANVSHTTRAAIQAQAAAEAGIAAADIATKTAPCSVNELHSTGEPQYDVTLQCTSSELIVTSTGTAPDGSRARVQSRFELTVIPPAPAQGEGNFAVFTSGATTLRNNTTVTGDMHVNVTGTGTVSLQDMRVSGDLYVSGPLSSTVRIQNNSSSIGGNVYVNGSVEIDTGNKIAVGGDIVAGGFVTLLNGSDVGGNIYAGGTVTLQNGAVIGKNLVVGNGNLAWQNSDNMVNGSARIGGQLSGNNWGSDMKVGDTAQSCVMAGAQLPQCPSAPTFPTEVNSVSYIALPNYTFNVAEWTSAGWSRHVPTTCAGDAAREMVDKWPKVDSAFVPKLLIDLTGCPQEQKFDGKTYNLKGDLAIVTRSGISQNNSTKFLSSTAREMFWIVPGDVATWSNAAGITPIVQVPASCDKNVSTDNIELVDITWFSYTPCKQYMRNSFTGYTGQSYAGAMPETPNNANLQYKEVYPPGFISPSSGSGSGAGGGSGAAGSVTRSSTPSSLRNIDLSS